MTDHDEHRRLFVPLASGPYDWFASRRKTWEVRRVRGSYSAERLWLGRRVELRRGYRDTSCALWGSIRDIRTTATAQQLLAEVPAREIAPDANGVEGTIRLIHELLGDGDDPYVAFRVELDDPDRLAPTIRFASDYLPAVLAGQKTTTIRLGNRHIEPGPAVLAFGATVLPATVTAIRRMPFSRLTNKDAKRDGFAQLSDLSAALAHHYSSFRGTETVTVIEFVVRPNG